MDPVPPRVIVAPPVPYDVAQGRQLTLFEVKPISQPFKPNREQRRAASKQSRKKGSRIHGR